MGVVEVGGAGSVGVAFESILGNYIAPTKWFPLRSESLQLMEDKVYRTNIRGVADRSGAIKGYFHVEGDVVFEVTHDVLLYYMYASRVTIQKSGGGPYTYTFKPAHIAKASTAAGPTARKTLSLLCQRSQNPMAYVGCSVGQSAFAIDAGVLVCTASIIGVDESAQSAESPSWSAGVPFGPGDVTLEIPSGSSRPDIDTFSFAINDNLAAANRLTGLRKASYQDWGEREITASVEHDFDTLTDYNAFVNQTPQVVKLYAYHSANDSLTILINAAIEDSYQVNLSGLGDVVRGAIAYHGIYDSTDAYSIAIVSTENIT
jgi:hypothetical protein